MCNAPLRRAQASKSALLAGATGAGWGAGAGSVQCPMAACSGKQVALLAGATAPAGQPERQCAMSHGGVLGQARGAARWSGGGSRGLALGKRRCGYAGQAGARG